MQVNDVPRNSGPPNGSLGFLPHFHRRGILGPEEWIVCPLSRATASGHSTRPGPRDIRATFFPRQIRYRSLGGKEEGQGGGPAKPLYGFASRKRFALLHTGAERVTVAWSMMSF